MSKDEHIKVFLRIRPNNPNADFINVMNDTNAIEFKVDLKDKLLREYINNSKEKYYFKFNNVFNQQTTQERIFNEIAKDVCDSALEGYNGTIFAYGQTGSGKTYTITGGVERVEQRGIIPRALSYIFEQINYKTNTKFTVRVSYLEIYNNDGFDLLDSSTGVNRLEDLPKVIMRENADKQLLLYNLSAHNVSNETEALILLMTGDDNRVVAETPKNDASTRSHCIFMIQLEGITDVIDDNGELSQIRTLSKLHIVDLSGSEKATKVVLSGERFNEATNINLSLHHLGHVISSINTKSHHVPYRNTMMTMILRDSLGGNCKTRMIATCSALTEDLPESISTCRFAQSVSLVKNILTKNEVEDPEILIKKQRDQIEDLRNEIKLLKGEDQKEVLEENDIKLCKEAVDNYLKAEGFSNEIGFKDFLMLRECLTQMKIRYKNLESKVSSSTNSKTDNYVCLNCDLKAKEFKTESDNLTNEINKLKDLLKKKDNEMKGLLNYYEKANTQRNNNTLLNKIQIEEKENLSNMNNLRDNYLGEEVKFNSINDKNSTNVSQITKNQNTTINQTNQLEKQIPISLLTELNKVNSMLNSEALEKQGTEFTKEIVQDSKLSYDYFKKNYLKSHMHQENINKVQDLFSQGKVLAEENEEIRKKINIIKLRTEELKKEFKSRGYDDINRPPLEMRNMEDELYSEMKKRKEEYDINNTKLKKLKSDIEFHKHIVEENTTKLGKDFNQWHYVIIKKFEFESKNKIVLQNDFSLKLDSSKIDTNNISSINMTSNTHKVSINSNSSKALNDVFNLVAQAKGIINKNNK